MKKRMLAALLSVAMCTGILAGCGSSQTSGTSGTDSIDAGASNVAETASSTDASADEIELTMYHSWGEEEQRGKALYNVVDQFNQDHEGKIHIKVDVNNDFPDYQEKCKTMIANGQTPDFFHYNFNPNDLSKQESGQLMDFSPYMDDEWRARFGDGDLETLTIDGQLTSIPFEKAGAVWYYNTALFEKAGISEFPKTWDELIDACEKLKAVGVTPLTLYSADDAWYTTCLLSYIWASYAGTDALNAGGSIDTEELKKAATLLRQLLDYTSNDFVGADYSVASSHFLSEQSAIVINGSWFIGDIQNAGDEFASKIAIADSPTFDDGVVTPGFLVTDAQTPWACAKQDDPNKAAAAVEFMKYVTSEEVTKQLTLEGGIFLSEKFEMNDEDKEKAGTLMTAYIEKNLDATGSVVNLQRNLATGANALLPSLLESLALDQITSDDFVEQLSAANE